MRKQKNTNIEKRGTMSATKLENGAWEISERLTTKVYYGYTKREALALFKADIVEKGYKIVK